MIKLEYTGNVKDLQTLLTDLPASIKDLLVVSFTGYSNETLSLERRAVEVAAFFMASGQKIQAIKAVRELTSMGLKEAKDFVEARFPDYKPSY